MALGPALQHRAYDRRVAIALPENRRAPHIESASTFHEGRNAACDPLIDEEKVDAADLFVDDPGRDLRQLMLSQKLFDVIDAGHTRIVEA